MGLKFNAIVIGKKIQNSDIAHAIKDILLKEEKEYFDGKCNKKDVKNNCSFSGSKVLVSYPYHEKYGFRTIFIESLDENEDTMCDEVQISKLLSEKFKDEYIFHIMFHSSCDSGHFEVYLNGEMIKNGEDEEGEMLKCVKDSFFEIYGGKKVLKIFRNYFEKCHETNGYSMSSYPYLKYVATNPTHRKNRYFCKQYEQIQKLIKNPNMTDEELLHCVEDGYPAKHIRKYISTTQLDKLDNKAIYYLLTEGYFFSEDGCKYLEEPKLLTYDEYFSEKIKSGVSYMQYRDRE